MKWNGKLKFAAFGAVALIVGILTSAAVSSAASATEAYVPPDISSYCQPVYETQDNPEYVPAVDQWYSWTGGQSDDHPAPPAGSWNPDNGNHNGQPFQGHINEAFQVSQGNSANWFYLQSTPAIGEPTIEVQVGEWCELVVTWDPKGWYPNATDASNIGWPQFFVSLGQVDPTACETTYQQDWYKGWRQDIDAMLLDGILTGPNPPEDHLVVEDWNIVSTGACPIPPTPTTLATPLVKDLCGWSNDHYGLPAHGNGVKYNRDGRAILATLADGYVVNTVPAGWVAVDGGYRYAFNLDLFDDSTPCAEQPQPQAELRDGEDTPTCEALTVNTWSETRTRVFVYNVETEAWEVNPKWSPWTIVAESQAIRDLTADEITALNCPKDNPPPPPPPTTVTYLGETGPEGWVTVAALGVMLALAGVALRMAGRRKA